ncbi:TrmB family transcriptional regulator [Streptomyces brasiliensis]|uniref:Transcriptional regulator n=1 Tax=Streptomyces brasiliensis TaxID=1954 RepID=A0A917P171_9ACTN|nr:helix-turn-helix domain-containing protein [Streptomyces brasiliensis]GGJ51257.1 transcriptional regulator [Streptomyces brasiliensis]
MELDIVGLSDETQLVYAALVGLPRSTASEVAGACELNVSTVGRLLSALVRGGLATRSAGRPPHFTAAAPDVAVSELIQEREKRLEAARSLVRHLADRHREAHRISDPNIAVELLTSHEDISAAVQRLTDDARHQIRAFDRPPYIDRPGSNLETQRRRQRTGVAHRVIYDRAAVAWPGRLRNDILPSIRVGEQARVLTELPLKLVVVDDRWAIIPFSLAPGGHSAAYLIHRSPMLTALEALFEAEWERATPLRDTNPRTEEPGGPDADTLALLGLLASGCTDAAIARIQGWSQRTTQRRIHRLITDLGATTRFQAAAQAARRGWLQ